MLTASKDKQIVAFVFPSLVTMITTKEMSKLFLCHYKIYSKKLLQSTDKKMMDFDYFEEEYVTCS